MDVSSLILFKYQVCESNVENEVDPCCSQFITHTCLSSGRVERPRKVEMAFDDENGRKKVIRAEG